MTLLTLAAREGFRYLNTSSRFNVKEIIVEGASPRIEKDLLQKLDNVMGQNIFRIDLNEIHARTMTHSWIDQADIYAQLPGSLRLRIGERLPAGLVRLENAIYLVSKGGLIICPYSDYDRVLDLPVITGLNRSDQLPQDIRASLAVLNKIRRESLLFWRNIETIDFKDNDNMVVRLREERAPIYLGDEVIAANLTNYLSIARHIKDNYPALDYIELGFPNQVAIMPKKNGN